MKGDMDFVHPQGAPWDTGCRRRGPYGRNAMKGDMDFVHLEVHLGSLPFGAEVRPGATP